MEEEKEKQKVEEKNVSNQPNSPLTKEPAENAKAELIEMNSVEKNGGGGTEKEAANEKEAEKKNDMCNGHESREKTVKSDVQEKCETVKMETNAETNGPVEEVKVAEGQEDSQGRTASEASESTKSTSETTSGTTIILASRQEVEYRICRWISDAWIFERSSHA